MLALSDGSLDVGVNVSAIAQLPSQAITEGTELAQCHREVAPFVLFLKHDLSRNRDHRRDL